MTAHLQSLYGRDTTGLLTRQQVADHLGLSWRSVLRLEQRGGLVAVRLGRSVRYRPKDVDALIERGLQNDEDPAGVPGLVTTSADGTGEREQAYR